MRALRAESERSRLNPEKADHELGLPFHPLQQTLADTISWCRQNGFA